MLTKEQIANWRIVLINMGIMPAVVDRILDEDIQLMASNLQKRIALESVVEQEKEKIEHRKKNDKISNQYDVIPGFKNSIKISKR